MKRLRSQNNHREIVAIDYLTFPSLIQCLLIGKVKYAEASKLALFIISLLKLTKFSKIYFSEVPTPNANIFFQEKALDLVEKFYDLIYPHSLTKSFSYNKIQYVLKKILAEKIFLSLIFFDYSKKNEVIKSYKTQGLTFLIENLGFESPLPATQKMVLSKWYLDVIFDFFLFEINLFLFALRNYLQRAKKNLVSMAEILLLHRMPNRVENFLDDILHEKLHRHFSQKIAHSIFFLPRFFDQEKTSYLKSLGDDIYQAFPWIGIRKTFQFFKDGQILNKELFALSLKFRCSFSSFQYSLLGIFLEIFISKKILEFFPKLRLVVNSIDYPREQSIFAIVAFESRNIFSFSTPHGDDCLPYIYNNYLGYTHYLTWGEREKKILKKYNPEMEVISIGNLRLDSSVRKKNFPRGEELTIGVFNTSISQDVGYTNDNMYDFYFSIFSSLNEFKIKHILIKSKSFENNEFLCPQIKALFSFFREKENFNIQITSESAYVFFEKIDLGIVPGISSVGREMLTLGIPTIFYDVLNMQDKHPYSFYDVVATDRTTLVSKIRNIFNGCSLQAGFLELHYANGSFDHQATKRFFSVCEELLNQKS